MTKRPEPIQIRKAESIPHLFQKDIFEEKKSPVSLKSSSDASVNSSSNSLIGYNQNNNYNNHDIIDEGEGTLVSPKSANDNGYGPPSGGGALSIMSDNYSDGASLIDNIISNVDDNDYTANDYTADDDSGGVYLNDPYNQYNSNTSATTFTNLVASPLAVSHGIRNGGGIRARLDGITRNKLGEIFEEPINISEYINNSDKDVWLLKLVSKLSNDLNKIFKSSTDFDVVIEVGQEPNTKIFNAHSTILRARSPFFSNVINREWVRDEYGKFFYKKENVTPKVFECIISYIYTGIIKIAHLIPAEILELLVACDEMFLGELIDYLQGHLIANHYKWFQQNIVRIQKISFQHDSFAKLQKFCTTLVFDNPKILFHSKDFTMVDKDFFLMLLNQDDLVTEENEIWDFVIHWGQAQDIRLNKNLNIWTSEDFRLLGFILKDFIPLIRFSEISSKDFYKKVKPFSRILGTDLYEELLQHYLVAGSNPSSDLLTRKRKQKNLDSLLIVQAHISLISSWIDRKEKPYDEAQTPYKFELLLRGTRDDFTAQTFHNNCDNVERTVVIMRLKGTTKLIGGYNPVYWYDDTNDVSGGSVDNNSIVSPGGSSSNSFGADGSGGIGGGYFIETKESFIFTSDVKKPKKGILSRVSNPDKAIYHHENTGPNFLDLKMRGHSEDDERCYYRQFVYDKNLKIKTSKENNFSIDEYEVFRIIAL